MDISDKLDESCRLCDENCDKMYSIFAKNEEGFEMLQLIKECLPIIIYRTDPLSKLICESCYNNVNALYTFKKIAEETADRQKDKLKASFSLASKKKRINSDSQTIDSENQPADVETDPVETENQSEPKTPNGPDPEEECVRLFLACSEEPEEGSELKDKGTSTDDLTIYCYRCKQSLLDPSAVNGELELCTDLHKAIAESMAKNKVTTESASEKLLRKRKVVPFYHELEDSLCSSLTEFTHNTEGSQCYEMPSDLEDSLDSDEVQPRLKRRRIIESDEENENTTNSNTDKGLLIIKKTSEINSNFESLFMDEEEYRYQPLSLMNIVLNFINKQNDPEYEPPDECSREIIFPTCNHCGKQFQNYKLIAIHEMQQHIEVEVDEKIDNPLPWREDREDALVRNKWLNYFDENGYGDEDIIINESVNATEDTLNTEDNSLLIPVEDKIAGDGVPAERTLTGNEKIVLEGNQPMVNGVYLGDYTKEERKTFYQTMRIQGVNKKFCELCRYTFKDNWAIESHYFSSACYYTCRHCGMRFNKQRHKYKEHMDEHKAKNDPISDKIYAASKISNIVPKILHLPKPKKIVVTQHNPQKFREDNNHSIRVKNFTEKRPFPLNMQIKEEPVEYSTRDIITTQSKTGNQAYFCRKCYKVFFKLDEFNVHSKNCDYNQFPQTRAVKPAATNSNNNSNNKNGEVSPAGRPIRNCAKEIGPYKDEAYLPESILKEPRTSSASSNSNQSFVCFICNIAFPTIYSRNSHMRIHKADAQFMPGIYNSRHISQQQSKPPSHHHHQQQNHHLHGTTSNHHQQQQNYRTPLPQQHYQMGQHINMDIVKQEPMDMPMEPMVEIHEQESSSFTSSIGDGAVSITPISKNPKHKPSINPHIMRIVQNNPNISIKPRSPEKVQLQQMPSGSGSTGQMHMSMGVPLADDNRSYKCSSCWEAFANKSHLYFHKKNQCEGSRLPCPFCKKRFGTEAEYSSHIYYSHPE